MESNLGEFHKQCFTLYRCASRREIRQCIVVASRFTIGGVHFPGNSLQEDNVDMITARFLTSPITGEIRMVETIGTVLLIDIVC